MSSFPYKNPVSSVQLSLPNSVNRTSTQGTNFSTLGIGGYMEVYSLNDFAGFLINKYKVDRLFLDLLYVLVNEMYSKLLY